MTKRKPRWNRVIPFLLIIILFGLLIQTTQLLINIPYQQDINQITRNIISLEDENKELPVIIKQKDQPLEIRDSSVKEIKKTIKRKDTEYVEINQRVFLLDSYDFEEKEYKTWNIKKIKADDAWEKTKGDNVKIAIIDTGVQPHEDLEIEKTIELIFEEDTSYHANLVTGIINAQHNNIGIKGIAPKAEIYSIKALTHEGGYLSDILRAIDYAIEEEVDIISMSFGFELYSQAFYDKIREAEQKGIILVAASGNEAYEVVYPAKYEEVFAVGSVNENNELSSFSSYGVEQFIVAPGEEILSTYKNNRYIETSGTSISTPHVTGVIALIKSEFPDLTKEEIRDILENDALDLGKNGRDEFYGYGLVQINLENSEIIFEPHNQEIEITILDSEGNIILEKEYDGKEQDTIELKPGEYKIIKKRGDTTIEEEFTLKDGDKLVIPLVVEWFNPPQYHVDAPWRVESSSEYVPVLLSVQTLLSNDIPVLEEENPFTWNAHHPVLWWINIWVNNSNGETLVDDNSDGYTINNLGRVINRFWYTDYNIPMEYFVKGETNTIKIEFEIYEKDNPHADIDSDNSCWGSPHDTSLGDYFYLKTYVSEEDLPSLKNWYQGDTHFHTIYTDNEAEIGNPVSSSVLAGKAIGLDFTFTTDHSNDFDSVKDTTNFQRGLPYEDFTEPESNDKWGALRQEIIGKSSDEFRLILGEEVNFKFNDNNAIGHYLVYGINDFIYGEGQDGVDYQLFGLTKQAEIGQSGTQDTFGVDTMNLQEILTKLNNNEFGNLYGENNVISFAAHPYNEFKPGSDSYEILKMKNWWDDNYNSEVSQIYTNEKFNGFQIWNGRASYMNDVTWKTSEQIENGVEKWDEILTNSLTDNNYLKLYAIGGSDAHGDFNSHTYRHDEGAPLVDKGEKHRSMTNVFGNIRTVVFSKAQEAIPTEAQILTAMKNGNTIITDGPLIVFGIDNNQDADINDNEDTIIGESLEINPETTKKFKITYKSTNEFGNINQIRLMQSSTSSGVEVRETYTPNNLNGEIEYQLSDALQNQNYNTYFRLEAYTDKGYRVYTNPIWLEIGTGVNPDISSLSIKEITLTTAVVKWNTAVDSNSIVNYGNKKIELPKLTKDHSVTLVGLLPDTTYDYKVSSIDENNNRIESEEYIFKTLEAEITNAEGINVNDGNSYSLSNCYIIINTSKEVQVINGVLSIQNCVIESAIPGQNLNIYVGTNGKLELDGLTTYNMSSITVESNDPITIKNSYIKTTNKIDLNTEDKLTINNSIIYGDFFSNSNNLEMENTYINSDDVIINSEYSTIKNSFMNSSKAYQHTYLYPDKTNISLNSNHLKIKDSKIYSYHPSYVGKTDLFHIILNSNNLTIKDSLIYSNSPRKTDRDGGTKYSEINLITGELNVEGSKLISGENISIDSSNTNIMNSELTASTNNDAGNNYAGENNILLKLESQGSINIQDSSLNVFSYKNYLIPKLEILSNSIEINNSNINSKNSYYSRADSSLKMISPEKLKIKNSNVFTSRELILNSNDHDILDTKIKVGEDLNDELFYINISGPDIFLNNSIINVSSRCTTSVLCFDSLFEFYSEDWIVMYDTIIEVPALLPIPSLKIKSENLVIGDSFFSVGSQWGKYRNSTFLEINAPFTLITDSIFEKIMYLRSNTRFVVFDSEFFSFIFKENSVLERGYELTLNSNIPADVSVENKKQYLSFTLDEPDEKIYLIGSTHNSTTNETLLQKLRAKYDHPTRGKLTYYDQFTIEQNMERYLPIGDNFVPSIYEYFYEWKRDNITLRTGNKERFRVCVYDRDDEPFTLKWYLDGELVKEDSITIYESYNICTNIIEYNYTATQVGQHNLTVIADDNKDQKQASWKIIIYSEEEIKCYNDNECNDFNYLTIDTCINPKTPESRCENTLCNVDCNVNSQCNDNDPLTTDICLSPGVCDSECVNQNCDVECYSKQDCDDDNVLTSDICLFPGTCNSQCSYESCDIECSDGNDCDDGDSTTVDSCWNPNLCSAQCKHESCSAECNSDSQCNDNNPLTEDSCMNKGYCVAQCLNIHCNAVCTTDSGCTDNNPSTWDRCINANTCNARCENSFCTISCENNNDCNDNNALTSDICLLAGTCNSRCSNLACDVECSLDTDCEDNNIKTVDICQSRNTCDASCSNVVAEYKPDLVIEGFREADKIGNYVLFEFKIKNIGTKKAENIYWIINMDSNDPNPTSSTPISLEPGDLIKLMPVAHYENTGTYNPKVIVDYNNIIAELDEDNNQQSVSVII